jgi:hypothetical protein
VPFGSATGPFVDTIDPLEWVISALALIGVAGLLLDFFHPWRSRLWRSAVAEMMVGFLWSASAFYEVIVPSPATWEWRLGHGFIYGGFAVLALSSWRWINKGNIRGRRG